MLLPYSWSMRWNTRSAPVRSTRQATPGNFASNDFEMRSARGKSTEVYQTTLPSFLAASNIAGVIAVAGGAAARSGDANTVDAAIAVEALRTSRLESLLLRIAIPPGIVKFLLVRPSVLDHLQHDPSRQPVFRIMP